MKAYKDKLNNKDTLKSEQRIKHEPESQDLERSHSNKPLISVIIPCYNQAHFLRESIESVLEQDYPNVETIVIDDGSPDNTYEVVDRYTGVRYIRQTNQGLSGALNTGIRESSGDYLVFLDADDRLVPGALAAGFDCLQTHPECAFVSGHHRHIKADGSLLGEFPAQKIADDHYFTLLHGNYIGMHATVMYRRSALTKSGQFNSSLKACEDYEMFLRITRISPVYRYDQIVAEYRQHDSNMSRDSSRMLKSALAALKLQWKYVENKPEYRRAFKTGIRWWRSYFRTELLGRIKNNIKDRHWLSLIGWIPQLLRFSLSWGVALLLEMRVMITTLLQGEHKTLRHPP